MAMVDINDHFSIIRAPLKVGDGASVKPVPTPTHHNIDISSLSSEGLQALKKRDPFLYYSIPGVRAAVNISMKTTHSSISVERRSCVSVEVDILHSLILQGDEEEKLVYCLRAEAYTTIS